MVVLTSILIPTWDIPIGRINFNHLCETEAGQFIYKQVPLDEEYFLKVGERNTRYSNPRSELYYAKGDELNLKRIEQDYVIDTHNNRNYSRWGHIFKRETTIITLRGKETLSRAVSFHYGSGWMNNFFSIGMTGSKVCPPEGRLGKNRAYTIHSNLPDKTFIEISKNQKGQCRLI